MGSEGSPPSPCSRLRKKQASHPGFKRVEDRTAIFLVQLTMVINQMRMWVCMVATFTATPVLGQAVFNTTPDWVSSDTPYSTGAALVDLDRDGWLDFVVGNGNDIRREKLAVYYNNGDGTLPNSPSWLAGDYAYNGHISVADVNGDGWLDVAVGLTMEDPGHPTAKLYLNTAGTLSSLPVWETPDELAAFHVAFGDVNGDGRPDLAVGTGFPYSGIHRWHNYVYMNVGGMLEETASWISDDTFDYMDVVFCDVNKDGWLDLVGLGTRTDTWVYLNNQGTLATTATWHTTDDSTQFALMGTYGNIDEDDWPELIITNNTQLGRGGKRFHSMEDLTPAGDRTSRGNGYVRRYDGLIGGLFTTTPSWQHYEQYGAAVALADIDADSDLDLATGSWFQGSRYFLNTAGVLPTTPDWSSSEPSVVEAIAFGDVDRDGRRWPVEQFDVTKTPGLHLFQLSRQPIETVESIIVDGVPLTPDQFTLDLVHGWISINPEASLSVVVHYVYSLKPDKAVTNWDDGRGNYLYYNLNDAARFGDFDDDNDVDASDYFGFRNCHTGPDAGPVEPACHAGDADLDTDIDCDDWDRFTSAWTGPSDPPTFSRCSDIPIPATSQWGLIGMTLLILSAGTVVVTRRRSKVDRG